MRRTDVRSGKTRIKPFQVFLEENRAIVYRFLIASAGPSDADDLFQETFLAALRAYPNLRDDANLRSWILTIATRKVIDAARGSKRRPVAVSDVAEWEERSIGERTGHRDGAGTADGWRPDPKDPLWQSVLALPAKQRAAVVHRFVLDRTYRDVGLALGCSEEAARANVSEAVRKLRGRWNHAGTRP
jgi:RNA polymerase sigma factor (sigma-70 family)